ncbi:hypothetical protein N7451_009784 [Penicillium sp. IBT 35674x]|nr:hypothetical protein N7451_009784 [Penicillium sp. IBT 35674x]
MSSNNTCSPVNNWEHHRILTLAYAVLVTIVFQVDALAGVNREIQELIPRLEAESESLTRTMELFREFRDEIPEQIASKIDFTKTLAATTYSGQIPRIFLPKLFGPEWVPWQLRRLLRRNTFLRNKHKLNSALGNIERRLEIEGVCSSALNRLVAICFYLR